MRKQITINRWLGDCTKTKRKNWKDLISSLVLAGYEVYGDEKRIVFTLGDEDKVEDVKKDNNEK